MTATTPLLRFLRGIGPRKFAFATFAVSIYKPRAFHLRTVLFYSTSTVFFANSCWLIAEIAARPEEGLFAS